MLKIATTLVVAGLVGLGSASGSTRKDAQAAYLAKLVRSVPNSEIAGARLGSPEARNIGQWSPDARWAFFTVRPYGVPHGEWQAHIVAALLAVESHKRGWRRVLGFDVSYLRADGRKRFEGGTYYCGLGGRLPCVAPVQPTSATQLSQLAQQGADAAGLTLQHLRIWSFLGHLAVEMTVVTPDGCAYLRERGHVVVQLVSPIERGSTPGELDLAEGVFLVVRDTTGRWIEVEAHAARDGEGIGGSNPFFEACP